MTITHRTDGHRLDGVDLAEPDLLSLVYDGKVWPDCSRTMKAAYQSGHAGSSCPVRASCAPCAAAARARAADRSLAELNAVTPPSMRPGSLVVTSWQTQPLPSGSSKEAKEP